MKRSKIQFRYPTRLFLSGVWALVPWVAVSVLNAARGPLSAEVWIALISYSVLISGYALRRLHRLTYEPFHGCSNIISSLRQGDFSLRSTSVDQNDPLGLLYHEMNLLTEDLRQNRLAKLEENRRFQLLIDLLEVAVIGFDDRRRLVFANAQTARWMGQPIRSLVGKPVANLGLESVLQLQCDEIAELNLPAHQSRFLVHLAKYREYGKPCNLLLLTDLKTPLREEERRAWKSLIRVISHEVNNSITPISSLAGSIQARIEKLDTMPEKQRKSLSDGLSIISNRSANMTRFINDYARLAKLPAPALAPLKIEGILTAVTNLGWTASLELVEGKSCQIMGDEAQLEQCLINLIRNAIDAAPLEDPQIRLWWEREGKSVVIAVEDNGPGISDTQNLFVPFFTTKPHGSGIGLAISQEIVEKHRGSLELKNLPDGAGCQAMVKLPLL